MNLMINTVHDLIHILNTRPEWRRQVKQALFPGVGDHLDEAEDNGHISEQEGHHVFALDLLWGGKLKSSKQPLILAIEVSWLAEKHDVERAVTRAGILRRIGLQVLPVVAGVNWVDGLKEEALRQGVVMVNDKQLDKSSWQAALAKMS